VILVIQVKTFVVTAGDPHDSAADILVIDDELHDVDPAAQLAVNQGDLYTASRVSFRSLQYGCSFNND